MKVRSTVSADVSKSVIWINSTDLNSTIKAIKIHEILVNDIGYDDSSMLEQSNRGEGVSISVCDTTETVNALRESYMYAKKEAAKVPTTEKHKELAADYISTFYS
ncbi:hypothetical protein [Vibrio splendidus]|uniref:hypothetical protein n=1 Tax=Vibrio splendidus TaxID=29497 RepID=UPI003D0CA039